MSDLGAALERAVREAEEAFSGELALALYRFGDPLHPLHRYLHRAEMPLRAASLIKLPLLVLALGEVAAGRLELTKRRALQAEDRAGGAGVLKLLEPGLEPSLSDLLTLMIVQSDNTATNLVIELLGAGRVNPGLHELGLARTRFVGPLQLPPERQNPAQRRGEVNTTTAADVLGLLVRLEAGELLPSAETALARRILQAQQLTEALPRYLPTDPDLGRRPIVVGSKSGCLRGLWHDAGVVYREDEPRYALVVMTEGSRDRSFGWEQEGMMTIARLSRKVFELLEAEPAPA